MDVLHLATHVLAGHQIAGVGCALTCASRLTCHHDAETLGGGIRGTGLGTSAINTCRGFTPSAWNRFGCYGCDQRRTCKHGVAGGITLGKAEMPVEGNLGTTVLTEDSYIWNSVLSKGGLVFTAIDVTADFSFIALISQEADVLTHFSLGLGGSAKEMLEVELDEAIGSIGFEEAAAILGGKADGTHEFPGTQVTVKELTFCGDAAFKFHQMGIAHDLPVAGTNQGGELICGISRASQEDFLLTLTKSESNIGITTHRRCVATAAAATSCGLKGNLGVVACD